MCKVSFPWQEPQVAAHGKDGATLGNGQRGQENKEEAGTALGGWSVAMPPESIDVPIPAQSTRANSHQHHLSCRRFQLPWKEAQNGFSASRITRHGVSLGSASTEGNFRVTITAWT